MPVCRNSFLNRNSALGPILERERLGANPGIPDLFLYRLDRAGRVHGGRFAEVKRLERARHRRERISPGQAAELEFLRSLGLAAAIVYLIED